MRLTGKGIWGPPDDPDECIRVLRRLVELGVNFIDTADSYGPFISERLIRKALHPYPDGRRDRDEGRISCAPVPTSGYRLGFPDVSAPGVRDEPAPAARRHHRPVPAAPHRPQVPGRGPDRRTGEASAGGQDPPHRAVRGQRRAARSRPEGRDDRVRAEHVQPHDARRRTGAGGLRGTEHRLHPVVPAGLRTSRGAGGPAGAASPPTTRPRRRSSRWPGCSSGRR